MDEQDDHVARRHILALNRLHTHPKIAKSSKGPKFRVVNVRKRRRQSPATNGPHKPPELERSQRRSNERPSRLPFARSNKVTEVVNTSSMPHIGNSPGVFARPRWTR